MKKLRKTCKTCLSLLHKYMRTLKKFMSNFLMFVIINNINSNILQCKKN